MTAAVSTLLYPTAEPGIYVRSRRFQRALDGLRQGFFELLASDDATSIQSTGMIPRGDLVRSSYIDRFPQFVARVRPELDGTGTDDLATLPSACLSLYPVVAAMGGLPAEGLLATVTAPCFRNEAGYGPERMRSFTMSEYVLFGGEAQTDAFRRDMVGRVEAWTAELGLAARVSNASDPFYGRIGEMLAERQRASNLKLELFLPIDDARDIACFSFNDHKDFFCSRWDIRGRDGRSAQSACVGVGLERMALAMFHRHGADLGDWPAAFRRPA